MSDLENLVLFIVSLLTPHIMLSQIDTSGKYIEDSAFCFDAEQCPYKIRQTIQMDTIRISFPGFHGSRVMLFCDGILVYKSDSLVLPKSLFSEDHPMERINLIMMGGKVRRYVFVYDERYPKLDSSERLNKKIFRDRKLYYLEVDHEKEGDCVYFKPTMSDYTEWRDSDKRLLGNMEIVYRVYFSQKPQMKFHPPMVDDK